MYTKLMIFWEKAARELKIEIEMPFSLLLDSGHEVKALFLVKHFGAPNGMLILNKNDDNQQYSDEIVNAGYGYSTLSEPLKNEEFDSDDFIELLEDWGWNGTDENKPF